MSSFASCKLESSSMVNDILFMPVIAHQSYQQKVVW